MKFYIQHQESYSRGELLLRTLFGWLYILLPHLFLLMFMSIWSSILTFISFWAILFTGRYPQSFFEFQVGLVKWSTRVNARMYNLSDGYPAFGINSSDEYTDFQMAYPESLSRGLAIVKLLFGAIYVGIPHGFILIFRILWTQILVFISWWVILFTGTQPKSWHEFNVGTLRWSARVNLYLSFMTDDYPPFSGREDDDPSTSSTEEIEPSPDDAGGSADSDAGALEEEGSDTEEEESGSEEEESGAEEEESGTEEEESGAEEEESGTEEEESGTKKKESDSEEEEESGSKE